MKYAGWIAGATLIAVGVVLLARPVSAVGYGWYGWHGHHRGAFGLAFVARQLDLTDAQKTQIKAMWQAERPTALQLVQQFADEHKQMSSATVGGNFDEAQVHAIAGQQAQTIAQLLVEKERLVSKIYSNVLTPEQRTKADQMRARFDTRIEHALKSLESGD